MMRVLGLAHLRPRRTLTDALWRWHIQLLLLLLLMMLMSFMLMVLMSVNMRGCFLRRLLHITCLTCLMCRQVRLHVRLLLLPSLTCL